MMHDVLPIRGFGKYSGIPGQKSIIKDTTTIIPGTPHPYKQLNNIFLRSAPVKVDFPLSTGRRFLKEKNCYYFKLTISLFPVFSWFF